MAIIYSYPTATPASGDLIVGTDITGNVTKNFTVGSIISSHITGTANTVPLFTSSNTIGDSLIKQVTFDASKTAVNVGTIPTKGGGTASNPYWIDNFQVEGTISSSGNITIGTPRELENQGFDLNILGEEGKIAFGDNNVFGDPAVGTPITWNVVVGEYGTGDTDVLQLHGKTGVVFTRGALGSTVSMSIDSSGNTSIGTVPTKGSGSTAWYPVWTDNFQVQGTMTSSGNVSIGTPREIINQQFDLNLLNSNSKISFGDNNKTGNPSASYTEPTWNVVVGEYGSSDTDQLQLHGKNGTFFTKGNLGSDITMVINNNGNVGIGTSTPSSKLDVNGNIAATNLTVTGDVTGDKFISSSDSAMFVQPSATSYFNHLRVDSTLGSTLSPGVYGWQFEYDTPHASGVTFRFDNDHYKIYSGATGVGEIVRFTDTGNVGIDTTNPQFKLDVGASMRIQTSNNLYFGGTQSVPEWSINASSSDLLINDVATTQGAVKFQNTKGIVPRNATTTEINAISSPNTGAMVYNTTLNTICFYNGSAWRQVSHTAM